MSATKRRGRQPNSAAGGTNKTFSKSTSATSLENTHGEGALNSAANSVSLGSNSGSVSGQKTGTEMLVSSHKSRSNSNKRSTIETVSNDNSAAKKSENLDQQPFVSGNSLVVKYRDGSDRLAKIICFTERTDSNTGVVSYSYYIHYNDFNRRMDEWIATDRIVLTPSKANIQQLQLNNTVANDNNENSNKPTTVADMDHDEHEGLDEQSLIEHEELTKVKNIRYVQLGKYIMECWYFSPFPKEFYPNGYIDCLYFCEFSLRFFKSKEELLRYQKKYDVPRHPPGTEIYRDDNVSMFELDGAVEKIYCQNLCYFAKLFLDHKTLYWDVDPFLFYVLCTRDSRGFHPVGYFSKEKYSDMGYNLACILTFPCVQRKGYGRFLIAFSYELSKKEEKVGSPEKPLSDLGALGYKSYWSYTILRSLKTYEGKEITLFDITKITSIAPDDVYATLLSLDLIKEVNQKPILCLSSENIDKLLSKFPETGYGIDADKLHWAPLYIADPRKDKWSIHAKKDSKNTPSNFNIADDINAFHRSTPSCLKMMKAGLSQESLQSLESIEASGNSNNRSAIDTQD